MMTNTYKAVSAYGKAVFGEDVFDGDFDATEEKDLLDAGHVEIVPRKYTVLTNNFSGGSQGSEYNAGLLKDVETALLAGGHLRRVEDAPAAKKKTAS